MSDQVSDALDKLAMPGCTDMFGSSVCSGYRLPLAVAGLGRQQGWVSQENAGQWAIRLFAICSEVSVRKRPCRVKSKSVTAAEDKLDVFEAAVGDGSLWAALVANLANARWEGAGAEFEKALATRELFREPESC